MNHVKRRNLGLMTPQPARRQRDVIPVDNDREIVRANRIANNRDRNNPNVGNIRLLGLARDIVNQLIVGIIDDHRENAIIRYDYNGTLHRLSRNLDQVLNRFQSAVYILLVVI